MKITSNDEIVRKAVGLTKKNTPWHHHYLPPSCHFAKESSMHQLMFENEKTKEVWVARSDEKPLSDLEKLEDLFFRKRFPKL